MSEEKKEITGEETQLEVLKEENSSLAHKKKSNNSVVVINDKQYEVLPYEEINGYFGSRLENGLVELEDDYVYRTNPETGALMYKETFQLPDDFEDASSDDKLLLVANYLNGLVPYQEKKLTKETMPKPLLRGVYYRLGIAAGAMFLATLIYSYGAVTWHVFPLAGFYSLVYLWNAALCFYYAKTRNFKMFSGIVTKVETKNGWSPSLKKTYIQISNGKKFLTFEYKLKNKKDISIGSPVTIFIPNIAKIEEGPFGPTVNIVLAVSFSLDVKSSDKYGEYQDGRMRDRYANEFFEDAD